MARWARKNLEGEKMFSCQTFFGNRENFLAAVGLIVKTLRYVFILLRLFLPWLIEGVHTTPRGT